MSELVGQMLGQYRVMELVGQGGMARVYKAYQTALDRLVAIKAIPTNVDNVQDRDLVRRFNSEARLVARLAHPNIVPVHDFGEDAGWAYIVMEYIAGGTLRERMIQAESGRTRLNLAWALTMMEQAAQALDFAHANGVVHRDVKPGNMLLRPEDHLLLSDFGIATILAGSLVATQSGTTVGTPQYMAPEQGVPNGAIDGRSDIYGLGVVLFQCVTGRLPFVAETPFAIIMKQVNEPMPRPSTLVPGLPPRVEQIILRATAKDPGRRYQRASEMAADLRVARDELRRGVGRPVSPTVPMQGTSGGLVPTGASAPMATPAALGIPGAPGTCFRCGAANNPQHRYCTSCGYDLSGQRARVDRYKLPNGHTLHCRITFRSGPLVGRSFVLHQDTTTFGRTGGNDIIIPDGTVSRNHARLIFDDRRWTLEDLQSSNGTFVNGAAVRRPRALAHGDELRLGDDVMTFELLG